MEEIETGSVRVVDRGTQEAHVFLRGRIDDALSPRLAAAIDEVDAVEERNHLHRVLVDFSQVDYLGDAGLQFLRRLRQRGVEHGFAVQFTALNAVAHRALEDANWHGVPHMPH